MSKAIINPQGCFYSTGETDSLISIVFTPAQERTQLITKENNLLFIIEGKLRYSMGHSINKSLGYGSAINIPEGATFGYTPETDIKMVVFKLLPPFEFCPCYTFDKLLANYTKPRGMQSHLVINKQIWDYLNPLIMRIEEGVHCNYLWDIKLKELFFLLKEYYTLEDLRGLFCNFRLPDVPFAERVKRTYRSYTTITELAASMNLTLKGFEKRFKKVFGTTPHQWIKQQRMSDLRGELVHGCKNLKTIAAEYGFAGTPQLNDFCKKNFNKTPGKIRKYGI